MSAEERERLADERRRAWRRRLAVISLAVAFVIIFCIAGIAAWLSFGAQKAYAFDRNGGSWDAATGFALLLDAGALGLSLLRLFEALTARSSQLTRFYLVAFIAASATMNLLHAPSPSLGGRLVAVIPPLVYAVFLETLLKKVEQLVLGKYPKRKVKKNVERGYSLLLWVPFVGYPWQMWKRWRDDLHSTLQYVRAPGSRTPAPEVEHATATPQPAERPPIREGAPSVPRQAASAASALQAATALGPVPTQQPPAATVPVPAAEGPIDTAVATQPASSPAPTLQAIAQPVPSSPALPSKSKKDQLRDALVEQIRAGDLRVLDDSPQVSNGAAYRANMELGKAAGKGLKNGKQEGILADGAVRAAVKQLLPELRQIAEEERAWRAAAAASRRTPEPAPEHQGPADRGASSADTPRGRQEDEAPVIKQQRPADASEGAREAALT